MPRLCGRGRIRPREGSEGGGLVTDEAEPSEFYLSCRVAHCLRLNGRGEGLDTKGVSRRSSWEFAATVTKEQRDSRLPPIASRQVARPAGEIPRPGEPPLQP